MKFLIAAVLALGLAACGEPDAQRVKVQEELKAFQEKCKANPRDAECVHAESLKGGG